MGCQKGGRRKLARAIVFQPDHARPGTKKGRGCRRCCSLTRHPMLNMQLQVQEFKNQEEPGVPPLFDEEAQPKAPEKGGLLLSLLPLFLPMSWLLCLPVARRGGAAKNAQERWARPITCHGTSKAAALWLTLPKSALSMLRQFCRPSDQLPCLTCVSPAGAIARGQNARELVEAVAARQQGK